MPATVTLSTTTLLTYVGPLDTQVQLSSTTGITSGIRLYADRELMAVLSIGVGTWVNVRRGVDGTMTTPHTIGATVYIGTADQFYAVDPQGRPPQVIPVSPYINVRTGILWFAQGDNLPSDAQSNRWWQQQLPTYTVGPLGITVVTLAATAST